MLHVVPTRFLNKCLHEKEGLATGLVCHVTNRRQHRNNRTGWSNLQPQTRNYSRASGDVVLVAPNSCSGKKTARHKATKSSAKISNLLRHTRMHLGYQHTALTRPSLERFYQDILGWSKKQQPWQQL